MKKKGKQTMNNLPSHFKSPKGEAEYMAAYEATMRLWAVPYEAMDIRSRFGITHLVVCGPKDAPPLILLHSFFMSLTVWAYNIADLSRAYRVYALDMMGQPSKSIPDQPMRDRGEMAEWLNGVLDALRISQMDLIGWSYGGFAALNYAIHRPDRLRKLVLLTPIGSFVPLKTQFYVRSMLTRLPGRYWSNNMMHWMYYEPNLKNEKTKRMFDLITNQFYPGVRYFQLPPTVLPVPYMDEELRGIKNSTLLLIGQQESLYDPVAAIERAKRLIPNIQAELIPHAGHELPGGQPETVNRKILEFLKGNQKK
ncbi:MAG: alpha/beta hydrolase [Candidatus Methanoperedens sp.]|nr:alpha/beta hydrolase [Candidatus Methanoperedens sp.]